LTSQGDHLANTLIQLLSEVASLRDPYIMDHSRRVQSLSIQLAQRIKLSAAQIKQVGYAAILHDIGKLAISEAVINKATHLTQAEYFMVQQHTSLGYKLMQPLNFYPLIGDGILYHHENFDGSGYLSGLSGEAIPLVARIIRITDMYDALTNARPYRIAFDSQAAVAIIQKDQHCFDPSLLGEFFKTLK
jgi:putative nucleotidyltransferase with HDIG domain